MVKPGRSDPEEDWDEGKREWQHQSKQQELASARGPCYKPSRSEPDDEHVSPSPAAERRSHEVLSFQSQQLEAIASCHVEATDEYMNHASDYYGNCLRAVQKEHHHTTGTGLIDVGDEAGAGRFHYLSRPVLTTTSQPPRVKGRSNPAMNDDWSPQPRSVPAFSATTLSSKPCRSESAEN